jgi:U3 small nucleolar RNA-associated protein 11
MAFSSLRKAAPRREHKERRQPKSRARLGLLEKHKDYVQRARNFHTKEAQLKNLKEKARLKNPDEFYFAMENSKTKNGIHQVDRTNLAPEVVKLMKTQDYTYVMHQRNIQEHKLSKLIRDHPELVTKGSDTQKKQSHFYFSDSEESSKDLNSESMVLNENSTLNQDVDIESRRRVEHEFSERKNQIDKLKQAERELYIKNLLTYGKGRRENVGKTKDGVDIYRWATERQK